MKNKFILSLSLVTALWWSTFSTAQTPVKTESVGRVSGIVLDVNDSRVANAKVIIKGSNFQKELSTSDIGQFQTDLPLGEYSVTVYANGFCKFENELPKITSNVTELVNIHLEVAVYDNTGGCKCSSARQAR